MKKIIIVLSIVLTPILTFVGCSTTEIKYFFSTVENLERAYCDETNAQGRAWLLSKIRERHPNYPESGLCGWLDELDARGKDSV